MLKLLRGLTIAIAVVAILGFAGLKMAATTDGAIAVTAALGSCSHSEIREGLRRQDALGPMRIKMREAMRKLRDDGKYQMWSTPQGDFWYRGTPSELDAFVLAEEQFDIYQTQRIKPGAIVLDCGANYGTFTRRALLRGAARW